MDLCVIESPYAGNIEHNVAYARACMKRALDEGMAPYASHLLFTQPNILDDTVPVERKLGMEAGFAWGAKAPLVIFCVDLGWSRGMNEGLARAQARNARIRTWTLGPPWSDAVPSDAAMDFAVERVYCRPENHLPYDMPVRIAFSGWYCPHCLAHVPLRECDVKRLGPR
jgi:hypothetical protein